MTRWLLAVGMVAAVAGLAPAVDGRMPKPADPTPAPNPNVDFEQKLGAQVPLELTFRNEAGQPVTLKDCVGGKPTILVMAYYRCPMLCNQVLNGLLDAVRLVKTYTAGKDFHVVVVSFDPKETPQQAADKKALYLKEYGRPGVEGGWHFLTGAKEPIRQLADAVGFKYEFDKQFKEYNHASGIMVLTPDGKLVRYFYGISYTDRAADGGPKEPLSADTLRLTLVEAGQGKIGTLADKLLLLCYRFDHLNKGYSLQVMRVVQFAGVVTVLALAGGALFLHRRYRTRPAAPAAAPTDHPTPTGVA